MGVSCLRGSAKLDSWLSAYDRLRVETRPSSQRITDDYSLVCVGRMSCFPFLLGFYDTIDGLDARRAWLALCLYLDVVDSIRENYYFGYTNLRLIDSTSILGPLIRLLERFFLRAELLVISMPEWDFELENPELFAGLWSFWLPPILIASHFILPLYFMVLPFHRYLGASTFSKPRH